MTVEQEIDRLAEEIQTLRIEYERFFSGALAVPPEPLRDRIQARLRNLRGSNLKSAADLFRLSGLEARLNSYSELFQRRLRNREEGRGGAAPMVEHSAGIDARHGVVLEHSVPEQAVHALYRELHREGAAGPRFDLDAFRSFVERHVTALRQKTGCKAVQLRVEEEGGRMKLKAKPVGLPRDPSGRDTSDQGAS
jgi:hypothetical protein